MADGIDFVPEAESTIDFQPEEPQSQPKVKLSPYEQYRLSGREPVAGPFGPANPQEVLALGEALQRPIIPLPDTQAKGPLAAAYRSVIKPVVEGIESPAGILMAPALAESVPLRIAAGTAFGGMAAKSGLEKMSSDDPQTQLEGRMELAGSPLLALLPGGRDKVAGKVVEAPQVKTEAIPDIPKITPETLKTPEPTPISEQSPPTAPTGEAQPSAAPGGQSVETPVSAGATPQPKPEVGTTEPQAQGAIVTPPVTEPAIQGMGGAKLGEVPETGAGGEKYGVAQRVREERAKAGQVEPVEPGEGINTPDSIARGREIITADPTAPEKALDAFEADPQKNISADGVAAVRAHGEALAMKARETEGKFGTDSPEYRAARAELSEWDKRSKAMQTEWHKIGMAQQGETDLDTGSFTGLERAYRERTGNDIPEANKPKAEKIAGENRKAQEAQGVASDKLNADLKKKVSAKDPETATVWNKANEYLQKNNGLYSFDDIRNKVATDLGMKVSDVTNILSQDKTTKRMADDLWNKQRNARRLKEQAKAWIRDLDTPGYLKALSMVPRSMFALKVGLHGTVALGTHAPMVAFQPPFWNTYVKNFGKMYKMVFSPAYYERQMQDLVRSPNYVKARRAGLQNDPFNYEEYHTVAVKNLVKDWIGEKNIDRLDKLTSGGNRGYAVLKTLRQDMFDQQWNALPDSVKNQKGVAEAISDGINHSTGVVQGKAPPGSNTILFAPRLAASRVMWLGGDPIRTTKAFANWKNAPEGEKQFAINQIKEKAWVFGTAASILALNQGFLSASGSKQKINGVPKSLGGAGFDPVASDFLKFKVGGLDVAYGSAMANMAKLPVRVATAIAFEGKTSKLVLEDERVYNIALSYLRTQLSPFAGTLADLSFGRDYAGRPLPRKGLGLLAGDKDVPKRLRQQGVTKPYSWKEYSSQQFTPIPISEGIREVWKGMGMPKEQQDDNLRALIIISIMAGTGSRVTEDTRKK